MGAALSDLFVTAAGSMLPIAALVTIVIPLGVGLGLTFTPCFRKHVER